jgi:aspartyl-tRNA(Asn)/glutamyl-tRNA(Gln) amidotransferase subunit C
MSSIDLDTVQHVARLARLGMNDDQLANMASELDTIMESIGKISELDLADVPPTTHALEVVNITGEDIPHTSLTPDEALANAPDRAPDGFRVPQMQS